MAGSITPVPQDASQATKVGLFTKTSGRIDWTEDAVVIERKIRGLNPWPSAYSFLGGKQLKLWDADVLTDAECKQYPLPEVAVMMPERDRTMPEGTKAGHVYADQKMLVVRCGRGALCVRELQLEGKKRMKAEDFLRGHRF